MHKGVPKSRCFQDSKFPRISRDKVGSREAELSLLSYESDPCNIHTSVDRENIIELNNYQNTNLVKTSAQINAYKLDIHEDEAQPEQTFEADMKERMDNKVILNIGGKVFVTYFSTLNSIHGTRLSLLSTNDSEYDNESGQYFYDRNPCLFPYILDFYRNGKLHFPHCICGPFVKQELDFWGISDEDISPCCWETYKDFEQEQKTLELLKNTFDGQCNRPISRNTGITRSAYTQREYTCSWDDIKQEIYWFLENPGSSIRAKIWSYVYIILLVASLVEICAETDPRCRVPAQWDTQKYMNETNPKLKLLLTTDPHPALALSNYICTGIFALELLVKFIVWPGKLAFFKSFFNAIDFLSIVPMAICLLITLGDPLFWLKKDIFITYCVLSYTKVLRAIRILKLVKHNRGLQILSLSLKASAREILLLVMLMLIGMLVFSTMIYYAEFAQEDTFETITVGFWWSIVTMTTVGYGDKYPTSALGYVVGSLCAFTGMLTVGLPIPVIASNFHVYYKYAKLKTQMEKGGPRSRENLKEYSQIKTYPSSKDSDLCLETVTRV